MKKKSTNLLLGLTFTAVVVSQPFITYADDISGTQEEGEATDIISDGRGDSSSSGNTNSNTNTGSNESQSSTSGSTNETVEVPENAQIAGNAQSEVQDILKGYLENMLENTGGSGLGIDYTQSGSIFQTGMQRIDYDEAQRILSLVDIFNQNMMEDWNYIDNTGAMEATFGSLGDSGEYDQLDEETKKKIKDAIAENEGLTNNHTDSLMSHYYNGEDGTQRNFLFDITETVPFQITPLDLGNITGSSWYRNDVIVNGFNDTSTWPGRFDYLRGLTSNSMEDYLTIAFIREYHIQNVQTGEIEIIDYTSDVRKWIVTDRDYGINDVIPEEHILEEKVTNTPRHDFTFEGYGPGTYYIIPAQEARYERSLTVSYDICDYLFDAATQNLLYFNERLVSGEDGKSIRVGTDASTGYVPTGDRFIITVNGLNEVEMDGSATERLE